MRQEVIKSYPMNPKKLKIILYLPLALFFIINFFYFSIAIPVEAAEVCTWYKAPDCTGHGTTYYTIDADKKCVATKPCSFLEYCSCCCEQVATPSTINTTMPKLNIPDIKLQITIPGLNLTKGNAIDCPEVDGKRTCNIPWIGEYIAGVYKYAIGIVGILAAVVLMIGGVLWIVAGGSATMIGEAKAWIGASLTGLVIALCSYLILYQINPALTVFNPLGITQVAKAPEAVTGAIGEGWGYDTGIEAQTGDASPELATLLNCMRGKLNGLNGVGHISSISDSNCTGNLSACKNPTWPTCTTAGQKDCHWHGLTSCHYGGSGSGNKSYAVDFNDATAGRAIVKLAAEQCGGTTLTESTHLHVSVSPCSGN